MNIISYYDEIKNDESSIFLAGPSYRTLTEIRQKSWRKEAVELLKKLEFQGNVFIPEPMNEKIDWNKIFQSVSNKNFDHYHELIEWEDKALHTADCILFWIPRSEVLPGFTTNDEFGSWKNSKKVVLGIPDDAIRCDYQKYYARKLNIPFSNSLKTTIKNAIYLSYQNSCEI